MKTYQNFEPFHSPHSINVIEITFVDLIKESKLLESSNCCFVVNENIKN